MQCLQSSCKKVLKQQIIQIMNAQNVELLLALHNFYKTHLLKGNISTMHLIS